MLYCFQANAQGGFFNAGFGYGFPAGEQIGVESPAGVEKNVYGSYAKGITVGIGTGYMANRNVGLDLGVWYVIGSTYEFEALDTTFGTVNDRRSGSTIRIMPAIKVMAEGKSKLYAKFGLIVGIATAIEGDETFQGGSGTLYSSFKYSGGSSIGWTGAVGIDFHETGNSSIFVELNFWHQNFSPDLLSLSIPGIPKINYKLVDEPNPAAGDELRKPSFPFSTIGITAGVKFSSGKKNKSAVKPAEQ